MNIPVPKDVRHCIFSFLSYHLRKNHPLPLQYQHFMGFDKFCAQYAIENIFTGEAWLSKHVNRALKCNLESMSINIGLNDLPNFYVSVRHYTKNKDLPDLNALCVTDMGCNYLLDDTVELGVGEAILTGSFSSVFKFWQSLDLSKFAKYPVTWVELEDDEMYFFYHTANHSIQSQAY